MSQESPVRAPCIPPWVVETLIKVLLSFLLFVTSLSQGRHTYTMVICSLSCPCLIHFQGAGIDLQGIPLKIYGEPILLGIG